MRELHLWAGEDSLQDSFEEIESLAARCRFRDCRHETEPGCAVRDALEQGFLDVGRYKNYLRLRRELRRLAARQSQRAMRAEKARSKKITKLINAINRQRRKEPLG
jgi:ribosome biogenesis GTPase